MLTTSWTNSDNAMGTQYVGTEREKLEYQESLVELERTRELSKQLMHAVKPLQEDRTAFADVV